MATPTKKISKSISKIRYNSYVKKQQRKLLERTALDTCLQCGETKRRHFACHHCGFYRGNAVLNIKNPLDKIKKVKA